LPASGCPIVRSTIQAISNDELQTTTVKEAIQNLDYQIESHIVVADGKIISETPGLQYMYEPNEPEAEKPEVADFTPEMYDALISAEVVLPKGDALVSAKVICRKRDSDANPIVTANSNPILDSCIY
jgi:hypothetical protein